MALGRIKKTRASVRRGPRSGHYEGNAKQVTVKVYIARRTRMGRYAAIACVKQGKSERCSRTTHGASPSVAFGKALKKMAVDSVVRRRKGKRSSGSWSGNWMT